MPPVATNLSAEVCKVGGDVGCECTEVCEDLGWEFVYGRERVSRRSDGTDGSGKAFFGADDLKGGETRVGRELGHGDGTKGPKSIPQREKSSYLRCPPQLFEILGTTA